MADINLVDDGTLTRNAKGEWVPRVIGSGPIFSWPLRPKAITKFLFGFPGHLWPFTALYIGLAIVTWLFLQPGADNLSRFSQLHPSWILPMYARNVAFLLLIAGAWHLRLYWARAQGTRFKYNGRWPSTRSKAFLFGNQVWDNMFWSLVSGAGIWTLYEVLMLWAYGHGWLPFIEFRTNPVWFVAFLLLIPLWNDVHFYWVHRITHWKPLYKAAHFLHHRNVNIGPWSGLSMHPLEHLLYFTRWLILLVVPAHPIHMLYLMQKAALNPSLGHSGFDQLVLDQEKDTRLSIDGFFHYLHHRYFECNYGNNLLPLDRWFGTFHDGTAEAHTRMRAKRRMPADAEGYAEESVGLRQTPRRTDGMGQKRRRQAAVLGR